MILLEILKNKIKTLNLKIENYRKKQIIKGFELDQELQKQIIRNKKLDKELYELNSNTNKETDK